MTKYVKMTLDEYEDLVTKQNEPSEILQKTIYNYQLRLKEAQSTIKTLEKDLSTYIIGGAKPRYYSDEPTKPIKRSGSQYMKWDKQSIETLKSYIDTDTTVSEIATTMKRTEGAIRSRASHIGFRVKHNKLVSGIID